MKFFLILGTLGLATFVVLKRRKPELAERVESAVKDAAEHARDQVPGDIAENLRDKAKSVVS
jgi:hypothetical protein